MALGCAFHGRLCTTHAIHFKARDGGDKPTRHDVPAEAEQLVSFGHDGGFGENLGSVLKARGGEKAVALQAGLGDAQEETLGLGRLAANPLNSRVLVWRG